MADLVPPVRPLVKHAKALEAALRREFLRPMYHSFAEPLARATAAAQAFVVMDQVVEAIQGLPRNGVPLELIQKHLDTLEGYHRERVGKVFQSALGVNVRQLLTRPAVAAFMAERLGENVALISTIPSRFHDGLRSRLAQALTEKPFDRSLLTKVVGEEFKASGYQLRRIVRDQTTKAIGGLTEIRQKQLGIEQYQWLTVGDTRVRESHQANGGNYFLWADPPAGTGHPGTDVQCRCVAIAVMSSRNRERLGGAEPSIPKPKPSAPIQPRPPRPQPSKATNKPDLDDAGPVPVQVGDTGPRFTIPTDPVDKIVRDLDLAKARTISKVRAKNYYTKGNYADDAMDKTVGQMMGTDDAVTVLAEALAEEQVSVYTVISKKNLESAITDNKFINALEKGRSSLGYEAKNRFAAERELFGLPQVADAAEDLYPKYGYLARRGKMDNPNLGTSAYGDTWVEFKPSVRSRSTVTVGDSLNEFTSLAANPLDDMAIDTFQTIVASASKDAGTYKHRADWLQYFRKTKDYRALHQANASSYIEVQTYGKLTLDDVAAIEVSSKRQAKSLRNLLDSKGRQDIEIRASPYDRRLENLWDGRKDAVRSLDAADVDRLGDAYIERIGKKLTDMIRQTTPSEYPEAIQPFVERIVFAQELTITEMRTMMREIYRRAHLKGESGLPEVLWKGRKKTLAGFTNDVMSPSSLLRYPDKLKGYAPTGTDSILAPMT